MNVYGLFLKLPNANYVINNVGPFFFCSLSINIIISKVVFINH